MYSINNETEYILFPFRLEKYYILDDNFLLIVCIGIDIVSFLFLVLMLTINEINSGFAPLNTNYTNFRTQIANSEIRVGNDKKITVINQRIKTVKNLGLLGDSKFTFNRISKEMRRQDLC